MTERSKKIKSALISVYHKDGLDELVELLNKQGIAIYSTGGTQSYLEAMGITVQAVESLTDYPSILGGRVKTLHPKVFGGILGRRELDEDIAQLEQYEIPEIDLVVVDLYPFEDVLAEGAGEQALIEKIDIGGISLIRAAAKNFHDVLVIPSQNEYGYLKDILENGGTTYMAQRKAMATRAFRISSGYDHAIGGWLAGDVTEVLRYGENPHQRGWFRGRLDDVFEQLHGKQLSYNNLLDADAACNLMAEFMDDRPTVAVLKHNNACGLSTRNDLMTAWRDALAGDPVSAFGGIVIMNRKLDAETAKAIDTIFSELVIAPDFEEGALNLLMKKKNRRLLRLKNIDFSPTVVRTALNGMLEMDRDMRRETRDDLKTVTDHQPTEDQVDDLLFANKLVKHTKSNTIVLAKNGQLLASGTGQTSRVDALMQAIEKAGKMGLSLDGAVMSSDAFFPFPDCVEIAGKAGIRAVIQPGGSVKDQLSIDYCNQHGISMVFTGIRHFKH